MIMMATISIVSIIPSPSQNPIINHLYTADPSARVFGDTLWLYPSHDKDVALIFSMEDYHAFCTTDMRNWEDRGIDESRASIEDVSPDRRMSLIAGSVSAPIIKGDTLMFAGDGSENARHGLQMLIDRLSAQGGGTVIVEKGTHFMNGPLEMKSGVCLHLKDGATLLFSESPDAYLPPILSRWEGTELYNRSSMIHAHGQENFAITGDGFAVIDANGGKMAVWGMPGGNPDFEENIFGTHGETPEKQDVDSLRKMGDLLIPVSDRIFGTDAKLRPCAVEFNDCKSILIEGITLKNSPFWCIHPLYCQDVTVRDVTIDSHFPNNDGCDPESCNRVLIEDCLFRTGDDAVAIKSGRDADGRRVGRQSENIVIRNCRFFSKCNGLCIGSELSGGVRNVYMKNIEIGDVKNAILFKSNLDRGGYIKNVYVDSIDINSAAGAVLRFETNYFGYRGGNYPSRYSDFEISNVKALRAGSYAIYYDGNVDEPISRISVRNFSVDNAANPYYLFKTTDCSFDNCTVNGVLLPLHPEEDNERKQCDVW